TIGDLNTDGNMDVVASIASGPFLRVFAARRPIPAGTDLYSFTADPKTRVFVVSRGPQAANLFATDYEVVSRGTGGTNTVEFPLTSTLRPSRPAPAGQLVSWYPLLYLANDPATLNMDNYHTNPRTLDADA